MATGIEHLLRASLDSRATERFNVVVAYDDSAAGRRGMELYVRLQRGAPGEMEFHCDLWRFDLLNLPSVRDAAVLAGMHAQLIVISANGDRGLPTGVKQWLEQSLEDRRAGSAALAALLVSERGIPLAESPVRSTLEAIAKRRSIEILSDPFVEHNLPADPPSAPVGSLVHVSPHGDEILPRRPRPARWGINE